MIPDCIIQHLTNALKYLHQEDENLLKMEVNERTITARLAMYLQHQMKCWNVDAEYNRIGNTGKSKSRQALIEAVGTVSSDDVSGRTIYPDIIIHKRGKTARKYNLLAIEVKRANNASKDDKDKLKYYAGFYTYAIFLRIEYQKNSKYQQFLDGGLGEYCEITDFSNRSIIPKRTISNGIVKVIPYNK